MPSVLIYFRNGKIRTETLPGIFRGLDWCKDDGGVVVVGDAGRIVKLRAKKSLPMNSETRHNLRAVSINPRDGSILTAGNSGTVIQLDESGTYTRTKINLATTENLRAVDWNPSGHSALIAGNGGALLSYSQSAVEAVSGARANLRRISWRPNGSEAIVTSNCFAEEFIPSPNLFVFDANTKSLIPVNEGRTDLIGVDWKGNGASALVVGYDVIWHTGYIGIFEGKHLSAVAFENKHVYPVAVSQNRSADITAIATASAQPGVGQGILYLWDGETLKPIFNSDKFFFSSVRWNHDGTAFAALASSATRTFNC